MNIDMVEHARNSVRISKELYDIVKNFTKKHCELVLARYNEDISWSNDYSHIRTVYNKGLDNLDASIQPIKLPNVGREAHTFLYHIIHNYDNLADNTIFFQAMINDRSEQTIRPFHNYLFNSANTIFARLDYLEESYNWNWEYYKDKPNSKSDYCLGDFCKKILLRTFKDYPPKFVRGAYISVGKNIILKNSKEYYQNILDKSKLSTDSDPEEAHFMERLWLHMFL
jgi:hypothetical protein